MGLQLYTLACIICSTLRSKAQKLSIQEAYRHAAILFPSLSISIYSANPSLMKQAVKHFILTANIKENTNCATV